MLHFAVEKRAPHEMLSLLAAVPGAAQHRDGFGRLALHFAGAALADKASAQALLAANPGAANEKDEAAKLPLHYLSGAKVEAVAALIAANPDAASAPDLCGKLPLHYVSGAGEEAVAALIAANPGAASAPDLYGKIPLAYAAASNATREVAALLHAAHPLGLYAMVENDMYADLVFGIVQRDRSLASASVDPQGRPALHLATGRCKERLLEALFLLGRYELLNASNPKHRSATARPPPPRPAPHSLRVLARCIAAVRGCSNWRLTASLPAPLAVPGLVRGRPWRGRRGKQRPSRGAEADAPQGSVQPRKVLPRPQLGSWGGSRPSRRGGGGRGC